MQLMRRRLILAGTAGVASALCSPGALFAAAETVPPWRDYDRATLDRAYNNSAAVPESGALFKGWQARSASFRAQHSDHLDLVYGPRARNRIDYFSAGARTPVLVFIHGGYWQMRSKDDFAFLAEPYVANGIGVAMVGYSLAPEASIDQIVDDARAAMRHLHMALPALGGDPQRMVLSGWSSGGHLATMALNEVPLRGGISISGLYELEPLVKSYLNDKLGMDVATAQRNSPLLQLPAHSAPLAVVSGTAELPELRRQSAEFADARRAAHLPGELLPIEGANHYTILNSLLEPNGQIRRRIESMLA